MPSPLLSSPLASPMAVPSPSPATAPSPLALLPRRQGTVAACAALAAFLFQFEAYVVSVALPAIAHVHHATMTMASFVVTAYLLATTMALMPAGQLAARLGLRRVFLSGCALFLGGTLLSGLAPTLPLLISSRALQGLGAGAMVATGYGIIPAWLDAERAGWGFGLVSLGAGLGMVMGVPVGGFLAHAFAWRWVFLVAAVPVVLLLAVAWRVLPRSKEPLGTARPLDVLGTVLFAFTLGSITLALSFGSEWGWSSASILGLAAGGALSAGSLFVRSRLRSIDYLPSALYQNRTFSLALAVLFVFAMATGGIRFLFPFYLEVGCKLSTMQASVVLLAFPIAYALASHVSGTVADRVGSQLPVVAACFLGALALIPYRQPHEPLPLPYVAASLLLLGASCGFFFAPNNRFIMAHAPTTGKSEAGALLPMAMNLGSVLGVALFETVFSLFLPGGLRAGEAPLPARLNAPSLVGVAFGWAATLAMAALGLSASMAWAGYRQPRRVPPSPLRELAEPSSDP